MAGTIRVGTAGWVFEPWRKNYYPDGLKQKDELTYSSARLGNIEINATFRANQKPDSFARWASEARPGFVGGAQRREGERAGNLRSERLHVAFVFFVEVAALDLVQHLQDAAYGPFFADGHGKDRARRVPGRAIGRSIEPRVRSGVRHAHGLATLRDEPRDALTNRQSKRGELGKDRHARHEVSVLGVDEPDRRALRRERLRHARTRRLEQRIEVDFAREERGQIDEERKTIHHPRKRGALHRSVARRRAQAATAFPAFVSMTSPSRAAIVFANSACARPSISRTPASFREGSWWKSTRSDTPELFASSVAAT